MSRIFIALAAAVALAACGSSSNNNTTTQTQAAITGLCQALKANCTAGDDQLESGEDESACEDKMKTTTTTGGAARDAYDLPLTDPNNDDLTCRENEAKLAASDSANKSAHCLNAGPTGGDKCGSLCDVFCDLQKRHCDGASSVTSTAPTNTGLADVDHATCVAACNAEIGKGSATHFTKGGKVNDTSGDTLQCRIWHLGKAQANPTPHCFHTRLTSVGDAAGATPGPCS